MRVSPPPICSETLILLNKTSSKFPCITLVIDMIDRHRSSLSNKVHHEFLPKKSKAVLAILFIVFFSLYVFNVCTYLAKYVAALKEVLCLISHKA